MAEKAPCLDCKDWYPACHDYCDRYQLWKADHERKRAAARNQGEHEIVSYEVERSKRLKRKKG